MYTVIIAVLAILAATPLAVSAQEARRELAPAFVKEVINPTKVYLRTWHGPMQVPWGEIEITRKDDRELLVVRFTIAAKHGRPACHASYQVDGASLGLGPFECVERRLTPTELAWYQLQSLANAPENLATLWQWIAIHVV